MFLDIMKYLLVKNQRKHFYLYQNINYPDHYVSSEKKN